MNAIRSDGMWKCASCGMVYISRNAADACCQPATPPDFYVDPEKLKENYVPKFRCKVCGAVWDTEKEVDLCTHSEMRHDFNMAKAEIRGLKGEIEVLQEQLAEAKQDAWDRLFEAALTGLSASPHCHREMDTGTIIVWASNCATAALAERERVRKGKEGV